MCPEQTCLPDDLFSGPSPTLRTKNQKNTKTNEPAGRQKICSSRDEKAATGPPQFGVD